MASVKVKFNVVNSENSVVYELYEIEETTLGAPLRNQVVGEPSVTSDYAVNDTNHEVGEESQ